MVSVTDDCNELDRLEHAPSNVLQSVNFDTKEEAIRYPKFNDETSMIGRELEVGLRFRIRAKFKLLVKNFSISNRFEVIFKVNDKEREFKLVAKKIIVRGGFGLHYWLKNLRGK
ncbi:Uncharacterized protein Adt_44680 [Abeliophyllum distichum]|uniref:Uncharacterized protein n=1 Tax=Abeliophyllum distichum TaxID=126358 RepID=A0ABD1PBL4_9LAMI